MVLIDAVENKGENYIFKYIPFFVSVTEVRENA